MMSRVGASRGSWLRRTPSELRADGSYAAKRKGVRFSSDDSNGATRDGPGSDSGGWGGWGRSCECGGRATVGGPRGRCRRPYRRSFVPAKHGGNGVGGCLRRGSFHAAKRWQRRRRQENHGRLGSALVYC